MLRRLKADTADLHLRAEQHVHILDRGATLADYRAYLRRMHGYHAPLERALAHHAGLARAGFDPDARCCKGNWLARDLDALADRPGPACDALPPLADTAAAIGVAYVIEGSMLGGRFILAKLPPAIASVRGRATRFLDGYASATGTRWRAFGDLVERELERADSVRTDAAVAGARAAFATLIAWLAGTERALAEAS